MEDIVPIVAQRTGLSEDQSRQAVETIVALLRERLREPARSMLDQVVGQPAGEATMSQEAAGETADRPQSVVERAVEAGKSIFGRQSQD